MGGILTLILLLSLGIILVILTIGLVIAGLAEFSPKKTEKFQEGVLGTSSDDDTDELDELLFPDPVTDPAHSDSHSNIYSDR